MRKPDFIKNWRDIQDEDNAHYEKSDELLSIGSSLAKKTGLTTIGIHHELLPPGRRTSWPHAESQEEEFAYVLEGAPDVWINGDLHRLREGDFVAFPGGTGIAHTFINNTEQSVRLLVGGNANMATNKVFYPLHPERNAAIKAYLWDDSPPQVMGPHDGVPDKQRDGR